MYFTSCYMRREQVPEKEIKKGTGMMVDILENNVEKGSAEEETGAVCSCHLKSTPREEAGVRQLKNRLNRMVGQLNGIGRMLDENRYCGDILTQVAAVESALQAFGYLVLQEHMETCVVEEIQKGNTQVVRETVELIKKLK